MKKSFFLFFAFVMVFCLQAQNNVITYTASEKLVETTNVYTPGIHTNSFTETIVSHTYSGSTGVITFSGDITNIGANAFYDCSSLTSITLPNTAVSIGNYAFSTCHFLSSVDLPESATSIGEAAFYNCISLTKINIPNHVMNIGVSAFNECSKLTSITIPNSVKTIGDHAFYRCVKLTDVVIGDSVVYIGDNAFAGCKMLTSVNIPNSLTHISNDLFSNCRSLKSILIPSSVESIGNDAFFGCSNLAYIISIVESPPTLGTGCFQLVDTMIPLYVPAVSIALYQAADQWNAFDIQPLLVEIDSVSPDTTNLTWSPVDSASLYQLHIYSDQIAIDTTLSILADPNNGGTHLLSIPSSYRQRRIVLDDGAGTLVVVVFDDNSGATSNQPFIVSVSTSSTNRIDLKYDMTILGASNNIIHKEPGSFTLNEDAPLFATLEEVSSLPTYILSSCFDLYGHRYPLSAWPSLPAGIYILHEGGVTTKIMKH